MTISELTTSHPRLQGQVRPHDCSPGCGCLNGYARRYATAALEAMRRNVTMRGLPGLLEPNLRAYLELAYLAGAQES